MKFKIEKAKINDLLKQINSVTQDNAINALYSLLLVKTDSSNNAVNFIFTNEKISIKKTITNILIDDDFSFCIKAKIFSGIISKLNAQDINFEKIDQTLNISTINFESNINLVETLIYPEIPFNEYQVSKKVMTINLSMLQDIYNYTSSTVHSSQDSSMPMIIQGIHFETRDDQKIHILSTDSFRASYYTLPNIDNESFKFVLEPVIIKQIIDCAPTTNIEVFARHDKIFFIWENCILLGKLNLDGNYPMIYPHFSKTNDTILTINNKNLLDMLEHGLTLVQSEKVPIAKISIDDNKIEIRYQSIDFGSSYESSKWETFNGNNIIFSINTKYLISILKIYQPNDILELSLSQNSPIIIKKIDIDNLKHLVLPLRDF